MSNHVIVWDLETIPDLRGFAAANGHDGKADQEIREAMGDKFPKHIYHSVICIGALVAHRDNEPWQVNAPGARFNGSFLTDVARPFLRKLLEVLGATNLAAKGPAPHFQLERIGVRCHGPDERRCRRWSSGARLSGARGVPVAGRIAAASQHGEPRRQSAPAHPMRLFSWR